MSAMTSRGTARRAGPAKPDVRWRATAVVGGRKMASGLAKMVRRHLMRTKLSEDCFKSVIENGLEISSRGTILSARLVRDDCIACVITLTSHYSDCA
jgi:hypothetical protein